MTPGGAAAVTDRLRSPLPPSAPERQADPSEAIYYVMLRDADEYWHLVETAPDRRTALDRAWVLLLQQYEDLVGLDLTWQAADGCLTKAPLGKKGGSVRRSPQVPTLPTGAKPGPSGTC